MAANAETTGERGDNALSVDVQIACCESGIPAKYDIRNWVRFSAATVRGKSRRAAEVAIRIVEIDEIRELNRVYRERDSVTNVLSFPADSATGLPEEAVQTLGDIVICAAVVRAEAAEQGKCLADHWCHVLVHGTLHLLGFDHQDDAGAAEMEGLEAKILGIRGVANPYGAS